MFRIMTVRNGRTIRSYVKNDARLGTFFLSKFKDEERPMLREWFSTAEQHDEIELKNRSGQLTTITKIGE